MCGEKFPSKEYKLTNCNKIRSDLNNTKSRSNSLEGFLYQKMLIEED